MTAVTDFLTRHAFSLTLFLLAILFMVGSYLRLLKSLIVSQRNIQQEMVPGSPLAIPGLDADRLQRVTQQLEGLGFELLEDHLSRTYSSTDESKPVITAPIADPNSTPQDAGDTRFKPQGFARVMVHPVHGCMGKIICVAVVDSTGQRPVNNSMSLVINSFTGFDDDDWSYTSTDRQSAPTANALMKMTRHPRRLATRIPGMAPDELLKQHLSRRAEVAEAAGVTWSKRITVEDDYRSEERSVDHIRAVYGRLSPLGMATKLFIYKRQENDREWLGDLKGRLQSAR